MTAADIARMVNCPVCRGDRVMTAPPTMDDLKDGTRVLHLEWLTAGTIRVSDHITEVRWEDVPGADLVSPEGPVFPSDLMITREDS